MPANNRIGYQLANLSSVVAALLNVMQGFETQLQMLFVFFIPLRDASIEVPTVVVEAFRSVALRDPLFDGALVLLLQIKNSDHNICYLDAGVIDIVLDIHVSPAGAQQ